MDTHALVAITCPTGKGCQATCSCGWESGYHPTAGIAGAVWDRHVAEVTEGEPS